MDPNLENDLARLNYNEEEITRRRGIVVADVARYVSKKYPELRDAEIIKRPKNSRSVLDLCGVHLKQKDTGNQFSFASWVNVLLAVRELK